MKNIATILAYIRLVIICPFVIALCFIFYQAVNILPIHLVIFFVLLFAFIVSLVTIFLLVLKNSFGVLLLLLIINILSLSPAAIFIIIELLFYSKQRKNGSILKDSENKKNTNHSPK